MQSFTCLDEDLLITGANRIRTSPLRNMELGVMIKSSTYEVLSIAADLETALLLQKR